MSTSYSTVTPLIVEETKYVQASFTHTSEVVKEQLSSVESSSEQDEKIKEANTKGNPDKIDYYLKGLNELWQKASIKMLKNAAKDGFVPNKKN